MLTTHGTKSSHLTPTLQVQDLKTEKYDMIESSRKEVDSNLKQTIYTERSTSNKIKN